MKYLSETCVVKVSHGNVAWNGNKRCSVFVCGAVITDNVPP